jgi:hypothetical protein
MSGFENNIINAANALIRSAMHSPNFVTGVSGWTINKDGSAEFNNLNLRGTFTGTNWIINADGMFFYNGTPALGNLNLAITNVSASGIDQFGNTYSPGGISIIALSGLANVFTLVDTSGNTLFGIDSQGNVNAQVVNTTDTFVNGLSIVNDIFPQSALGIVNRGWTPSLWPTPALGTTNAAILELDQVLSAGRAYRFVIIPTPIIPTSVPTQYVMQLRYTTDGSTPSTTTPIVRQVVQEMTVALTNWMTPLLEVLTGNLIVDTLYRLLITANVQAGTVQYQNNLEMRIEDLGPWVATQNANNGVSFGSGGSGSGGSKQTYTKNYVAVEFANYYGSSGSYGSGPYGQRDHNGPALYQGTPSGYINLTGDQYAYARFNYSQITTDIGAGTVNWVKLRLTNQHSWYNSGCNAVVGWNNWTGVFGDPFPPGGGTHMNTDHYHINEGATVTHQMSGAFVTAITSGFTSIVLGTSNSYTSSTDLNNYGYFAGAGNVNTAPQLTINYTK